MAWIIAAGAALGAGAGLYSADKSAESQDDAMNAQQKQNLDNQDFIKRQGDLSKQDADTLYRKAQADRDTGTNAAMDIYGTGMKQQLQTTGNASIRAQDALLAGNQQFQNAILGLPVDNSALQSHMLRPQTNLGGVFDAQVPTGMGMPQDFSAALSGSGDLSSFVQPGQTNQQLVAKAYADGMIDKKDYNIMQTHFDNSGTGGGKFWASTGNAGDLITNLNSQGQLDNKFRSTMENFFNLMYPDG
jgi:hypothetical protein